MDLNNLFFQSTALLFTICSTFLFFFLLFWLRRRHSHSSGGAPPPEAGGGWPLIGHLHLLGGTQSLHVTLGKMADKYGPIFTIRLGVHRTLIVSSSEMAKQCFTVNDKAFASRPKSVAFEVLGYNFSMIGFSPYGSYWRTVRKIATLHVFSTQRLEMLKHVIVSEVKTAMKESYEFLLKKQNEGSSSVIEMNEWFGNISLNVVFRTVVGKRFDNGEDEEENLRIKKALRELFDLSGSFVISDALPFLRWLDLDGREKEMKKNAKELDALARVWLHQHKRNKKQIGSENDFMDVLLSRVDDFDGRDADTTIKATSLGCKDIFVFCGKNCF
nr:Cytochrome P450 82D47 [Astragalus membranaceus]